MVYLDKRPSEWTRRHTGTMLFTSESGRWLPVVIGKPQLESLDRGPPFGCRRLADAVLTPEQPDFFYGLLQWDGLQPTHRDKVLALFGIVTLVVPASFGRVEHGHHDDDLVALVECLLVELLSEPLLNSGSSDKCVLGQVDRVNA